jgi:hypothetical protein
MYENKPLPSQAPSVTIRRTNPNPHSPHQRTSLLPRVLFPSDQSTAPLLSLSHSSTSLRFSLAPTRSLVDSVSFALGPGIESIRSAGARRPTAATPARMIGGKLPSSVLASANSHPSSANFPSRRRRRLSGNRFLLVI